MSGTRTFIHLISVALLFVWSAVLLYFYYTGRVNQYLPGDGIFRDMVPVTGIGLAIIGLFNLLTMGSEVAGCEGHSHGEEDAHDPHSGHSHNHKEGCCGHGQAHAHQGCNHDHGHKDDNHQHDGCCGHDHGHTHHAECGHDHGHQKDCAHDHNHESHAGCGHDHSHTHTNDCCGHGHGHEEHGHGILAESGWIGRIVAILILAAPITWAAVFTPDNFSAKTVMNKGVYNQNYGSTTRAEEFSLRKETAGAKPSRATPQPVPMPDTPLPPPDKFNNPAEVTKATTTAPTKEAQSYGSFTLDDLKAQIEQNSKGEFVLQVPEIYYTATDLEVQKVLKGQPIETTAQVLPEKINNESGRRLRIFRMLVQCCAADARPYSIPVEFEGKAPEFKEMTWVKISGVMAYEKDGDQIIPLVKATNIEETTAPDNTMLY
jgi:uncharacterized repeat protein (TIGR03943 family)